MAISAAHQDLINDKAVDYGDHENMSVARVRRWFEQFSAEHHDLAAKILHQLRYVSTSAIRGMTHQLAQQVLLQYANTPRDKIFFVPIGQTGGGASIVFRCLRDYKRESGADWKIADMVEIQNISPGDVELIVLLDDFCGTGDAITDWWPTVEPILSPKGATIIVGLLILNERAEPILRQVFDDVVYVEQWTSNRNVFANEYVEFTANDKAQILHYCRRSRAGRQFLRGYGECGLLLCFKYACPDNSIPLLWHDADHWHKLFNRRGI